MAANLRRALNLATKMISSRFKDEMSPYKMLFVVTKSCHSRCQNCSIWQHGTKNELTLEEIRRTAESLPNLSWIDFTGGEPTDRPDFVEVVRAFHDSCPSLYLVHFPTNGLAPEKIERMTKQIRKLIRGRLVITVSIDGPRDMNAKLRGIQKGFENSVETYKRVSAIDGVEAFVGMTIYPQNAELVFDTVEAIQKVIPEFDVHKLHLNLGHQSGHYYGNSKTQTNADRDKILATFSSFRSARKGGFAPFDILEGIFLQGVASYIQTGRTPIDCSALKSSFYLSQEGNVFPCSIWDRPLGNIRDFDYDVPSILSSSKTKETRKLICQNECPQCWTPCDAYPSIVSASGLSAIAKALFA